MNKLFKNVGDKIILMAKIILVLGVIFSLIVGIILMTQEIWSGLFMLIVGVLISISSALFTYGFGELINNTKKD